MAVDIFVQIGFVVLVGLACKNAILIVEFAKQQQRAGHSRCTRRRWKRCRLRLRPIIMTSFAFILRRGAAGAGHGAGAEMRQSLGTAVFSGMIGVTPLRHLPDAGVLLRHPPRCAAAGAHTLASAEGRDGANQAMAPAEGAGAVKETSPG